MKGKKKYHNAMREVPLGTNHIARRKEVDQTNQKLLLQLLAETQDFRHLRNLSTCCLRYPISFLTLFFQY